MVSLKDIAKACGISVTQVSRALNDMDDVSAQTKALVCQTAQQLGYVKNIYAQSLAYGSSRQFAVIQSGLGSDPNKINTNLVLDILKGVTNFAMTVSYEPVLHIVDESGISYVDFCRQRNIPGIIALGMQYDNPLFKALVASDFPCVTVDIPIEGNNKGCVMVNNSYYTMMMVKHLLDSGRKNVAMICGHNHAMVTVERRIGYESALTMHGIPVDNSLIICADFLYDKAQQATEELLSRRPDIDAIFCQSDIMALACLQVLKSKGIAVPQQIALAGFDGMFTTEFTTPTISTIRQDDFKKGYYASEMLYNILNHTVRDSCMMVPCELVLRESTQQSGQAST